MLKIHHLNNSRSQRILWLAEELDLEYEIVFHYRDSETMRSPESLKAVHPLGKAPVIEDDGLLVAETGAIIEYLTHKLGGGRLSHGPDSPEYGPYLQWLHYPEGSVQGLLVFDLIYEWTNGGNEVLFGFYDAEITLHREYIESALSDQDYILKSGFSAADINLAWTLEIAEALSRTEACPNIRAYLARQRDRSAYQRAMECGGSQDLQVFGKA